MDKRRIIYYENELTDEFSTAVIEAKTIDGDYIYDRKGPIRAFTRFFWYRIIATPIAFTVSVIVNYLICVFWVF